MKRSDFEVFPGASAVLKELPIPLFITDTDFRLVYANPAFAAVYGCPAPEAVGLPLRTFCAETDTDAEQSEKSIAQSTSRGRPWFGTLRQRTQSGRKFQCDFTVFGIADGKPLVVFLARVLPRGSKRDTRGRELARIAQAAGLTSREVQVLELLVLGRTGKEIAKVLGCTERTARFHIRNVLEKLDADSRADLLRVLWFA